MCNIEAERTNRSLVAYPGPTRISDFIQLIGQRGLPYIPDIEKSNALEGAFVGKPQFEACLKEAQTSGRFPFRIERTEFRAGPAPDRNTSSRVEPLLKWYVATCLAGTHGANLQPQRKKHP